MFDRILVPLDGSKMAEASIPWALLLAEKASSKVILVHVLEKSPPKTVHGEPHIKDPQAAKIYLEGIKNNFPSRIPVDIHIHTVPEGNIAASIAEHVKELGADLVILTAHGRQGIRGLILGSIGQQVLRATYTPVLLLRADGPKIDIPFIDTILLPLDGTEQSERALPLAVDIARILKGKLLLLLVVPTVGTIRGDTAATARISPLATSAVLELQREKATQYLDDIKHKISHEIEVKSEVLRGDPIEVVAREASKSEISLVVMATHGHPEFTAIWSASVGSSVQSRIDKPMLLIRP